MKSDYEKTIAKLFKLQNYSYLPLKCNINQKQNVHITLTFLK